MSRLAAAALCLSLTLAIAPARAASDGRARGPFLLVSLASLGVVTWRCDTTRHPDVALGFTAFDRSADTYVRLRAGGRTIAARHVLPGRSTRLPFVFPLRQQLELVQGTEAGTVRAKVSVD